LRRGVKRQETFGGSSKRDAVLDLFERLGHWLERKRLGLMESEGWCRERKGSWFMESEGWLSEREGLSWVIVIVRSIGGHTEKTEEHHNCDDGEDK